VKWTCALGCDEPIEVETAEELENHLRLLHPDSFGEGFERWPDGEIVVHDTTLEPHEFAAHTEEQG
jgi:hypothetical protein